jgi:hypothetical protein
MDHLRKLFRSLSFKNLIQDPKLQPAFEIKQLATRHQLDRFRLPDKAQQTLRTACSRQDAKRDFRQA